MRLSAMGLSKKRKEKTQKDINTVGYTHIDDWNELNRTDKGVGM